MSFRERGDALWSVMSVLPSFAGGWHRQMLRRRRERCMEVSGRGGGLPAACLSSSGAAAVRGVPAVRPVPQLKHSALLFHQKTVLMVWWVKLW